MNNTTRKYLIEKLQTESESLKEKSLKKHFDHLRTELSKLKLKPIGKIESLKSLKDNYLDTANSVRFSPHWNKTDRKNIVEQITIGDILEEPKKFESIIEMGSKIEEELEAKRRDVVSKFSDKLYLMDIKDFDVEKFMKDFRETMLG